MVLPTIPFSGCDKEAKSATSVGSSAALCRELPTRRAVL